MRQLRKVICWKDFAAGYLSFGLMQSLICGIATTLTQHKYLPFEVTVDNELPPLSLGCVQWRQLEVLPVLCLRKQFPPKKSVKSVDISVLTQQDSVFRHRVTVVLDAPDSCTTLILQKV